MNFEFYIFGKNDKNSLHLQNRDSKIKLLERLAENCQSESQMIVYRSESSVYYVYVKKISNHGDYFGIGLIFNGTYCTANKSFLDFFEKTIKEKLVDRKKILEVDLNGKANFVSTDFSRNKVEIDDLNNFFKQEIDTTFGNSFPLLDPSSFMQGDGKPQYISLQDESDDYIVENIKRYNYVIIEPALIERPVKQSFEKRIKNFKRKHKWLYYLICGLFFGLPLGRLIFLFKAENCTLPHALLLIIPTVIGFYFMFFEKFTKGKNEILLALFSFIVSILGLTLTLDNSVFSQSDGSYKKIIERSFKKDDTFDISNSVAQWDSIPYLVFVLDVSGSTKKRYENQDEARELFKDVCKNLRGRILNIEDTLLFFLKNNNRQYTEYDVYKLKILNIIAEEEELYQNKIHIACFADDVEFKKNVDCRTVIHFINTVESNKKYIGNDKTDFVKLLQKLSEKFDTKNLHERSQAPKYSFLFFSDYLHDIGKPLTKKDKENIIKEIKKSIYLFYCKQNFSNYFFSNSSQKNASIISDREISVYSIFKELAHNNDSKAHFVEIENTEYDFMDILSKEIIPIYYEHSYPKNNLTTNITFGDIKNDVTARISLSSNRQNSNYRHQFSIFEKCTIPVFPSDEVQISPNNPLKLSFSGRVVNNYPATTLTFQSTNHGCSRFDIVFFKDLPWFACYIIVCTIFFFYLFLLSMLVWIISGSKDNK